MIPLDLLKNIQQMAEAASTIEVFREQLKAVILILEQLKKDEEDDQ